MRLPVCYRRNSLVKKLFWLGALIVSCMATQGIAFALMLPIAFKWTASRKYDYAMYGLMIATVTMMMNGYFMPRGVPFYVIQKIIILSLAALAIFQMSGARRSPFVSPLLSLMPYLAFMTVTSQFGWCPIISNFKMFLFVMTFFAFYGNATLCAAHARDACEMREFILCLSILFIVGSFLLIPFPGISQMGSEEHISKVLTDSSATVSLFRGMTKHSQTLGPTVAILVVILYADWLLSVQRKDNLYLALLLLGPYILYKTSSRTAMGSMIAGVGFVSFYALQARGGFRTWRRRVLGTIISFGVMLCVAAVVIPATREKIAKYVVKSYTGETTMDKELILGSRQGKLDSAIENWHKSPVWGNGFQVTEEMGRFQVTGIRDILTAPVEKSTWTVAVLEEGGVIGLILFVIFILVALGGLISHQAYTGAAVLFTMVISNLGEFGIFSMSNQGGFYWAMTFAALILDALRVKGAKRCENIWHRP